MRYHQKIFIFILITTLFHATLQKSQYKVVNALKNSTTIILQLAYTGSNDYYLKPSSPISKNLLFTFHTMAFNDFTFKITDKNNKRFQVPQYGIFPIDPIANFSFPIANSAIVFEYTESPFDFRIIRKQNSAVLFSTYQQNIIFSDHYLQIGTQIDSDYVYGIGQRFLESFRKKDGKWTVFNRDRGQCIDKGQGLQTYGYYPFYLLKERNQLFHINYFRSSNAMDVIKSSNQRNQHFITYKVIGGVLDFRFFLGQQSPEATVEKLNGYVGRSQIPPFWSFGFHQCRWGYKNVSYLTNVIKNFESNNLPLDTIWNDIDYMVDYQDFTIDQSRFPLDQMKKILQNYRYIPIIDAGIKNSGSAYEQGLKRNVYVMDANGKGPYVGRVWPGPTTFVDFFHPNATQYWTDMLGKLYDKVKFDGIWLDMNELANFCDGACSSDGPSTYDYSKDLPYQPGADQIQSHTISLNATHYGNLSEANVHAFSAFLETYATNQFLRSKNLKPFIITRSSTFGSNKYGFHWTGDNYASWEYLRGSIADNFNNQMFGFQMVGPDICGFGGDTQEQLCARWFQLGALYTFARDHNAYDSRDQQPYALGDTVLKSAQNNLKLRYSLLKYFYYLFVSKRGLGTIWRPLFFDYPNDSTAYFDQVADTQFLIGPNIMSAPIVQPGVTERKVYFPQTNWFDMHTGIRYAPGTNIIRGVTLTSKVPLFVREGAVVYSQDTQNVTKTKQLGNSFNLLAALYYNTRNSTHKIYRATGVMLSIKDYNNDSLVDLCFRQGCDYILNFVVNQGDKNGTIELDITYLGGFRLNQQVLVKQITLLFADSDEKIVVKTNLSIVGPKRQIIPFTRQNNNKNLRQDLEISII